MDNNNFNPDFSQDFNGQTSIPDDNFNNINNISNNQAYSQYNQNQSVSYAAYNQNSGGQFAPNSGYNPNFKLRIWKNSGNVSDLISKKKSW